MKRRCGRVWQRTPTTYSDSSRAVSPCLSLPHILGISGPQDYGRVIHVSGPAYPEARPSVALALFPYLFLPTRVSGDMSPCLGSCVRVGMQKMCVSRLLGKLLHIREMGDGVTKRLPGPLVPSPRGMTNKTETSLDENSQSTLHHLEPMKKNVKTGFRNPRYIIADPRKRARERTWPTAVSVRSSSSKPER